MRIAYEHADSFVTYPQAPNLSAKAKPIRERQARQLPPRILVPAQLGPIGGSVGGPPGIPPVGLTGSSHFGVWGVVLAWGRGLPDD